MQIMNLIKKERIGFFLIFILPLLLCIDDPYNPLDPNDPRYQKTTIKIVSDNSYSGDTILLTTEEVLKLGIESAFLDRVDSIRIDYDTGKITDTVIIIKRSELNITSGTKKIDLGSRKVYAEPGIYTVSIYIYTVNDDNVESTVTVMVKGVSPRILVQPENRIVAETESVVFSVGAAGTWPLRYFWYTTTDTTKEGRLLSGDDTLNNYYSDDFVETSDSGYYYCIVRNDFGWVKSRPAGLTVTPQILDADAPRVFFERDSSRGYENVDAVIPLKLSSAYDKEVLVRIGVLASSSAKSESDYSLIGAEVVFPARSTSANLPIKIIDDNVAEGNEVLAVQITAARNAHIGEPKVHYYTILDDDVADSTWPEIYFVNSSGSGREGENASIEVGLDLKTETWEKAVSVYCRVSAASTAAPDDYVFLDTLVIFNINEKTKRISLQTVKDKISENDETVRLILSNPSKAVLSPTKPTEYIYTIKDGDICYIKFESMEMTGIEPDTTTIKDSIKVTLSVPSVNDVSAKYEVVPELSTAINQGVDYLLPGDGFVRFPAGVQVAWIPITITGDFLKEGDEVIAIRLTSPTGGAVIGNEEPFRYIISDNETISVSYRNGQTVTQENAGDISIPVVLSGLSSDTIRVDYRIVSGSAVGIEADFILKNENQRTLTFLPYEQEKFIEITIVDDNYDEPDKYFDIKLENVRGGAQSGAIDIHRVVIIDDDIPYFSFTSSALTVNESDGKIIIPVALSNTSQFPIRVRYSVDEKSSAQPGTDYTAFANDTAVFRVGDSVFNIELILLDDAVDENDETVILTLSPIDSTSLPGSITSITVNIIDNDGQPGVAFANDTMTVDEGDGTIQIPLVVSGASGKSMSVGYRVSYRSEHCDDNDFTLNGNGRLSLTQSGGNFISLNLTDDKTAGETDTFSIELYSPQNIDIGTKNRCGVVIRDNDYSVNILSSSEAGGVVEPKGVVTVTRGEQLTVKANPNPHYHFTGWSSSNGITIADPSSANTTILVTTNNVTLTANFGIDTVKVIFSAQNGTINPAGSLLVPYASVVTPASSPNMGYRFSQWIVSDSITLATGTLSDPASTFKVNGSGTITAVYTIKKFTVNIKAEPAGLGSVTPEMAEKDSGEIVDIKARPVNYAHFVGWSASSDGLIISGRTDTTTTLTVRATGTVTALFAPDTFSLELISTNTELGTVDPASIVKKNYFDTITIKANPSTGYSFNKWTIIDGAGKAVIENAASDSTLVRNLSGNVKIQAEFTPNLYPVSTSVTGAGEIIREPSDSPLPYGTELKLTAQASTGWHFKNWTGGISNSTDNPVTVKVGLTNQYTAIFERNNYTLTVTSPSNGRITVSPSGPTYPYETEVTLTAQADTGYRFSRWEGDAAGNNPTTKIIITGDKTVSAVLEEIPGVAGVVYVWKGAKGANNGSNWANAYRSLEEAFAGGGANSNFWIMGGVYPVSTNQGFQPPNGAQIYGGFTGYEETFNDRILHSNPTILSGSNGLNTYLLIVRLNTQTGVQLNGIIIENAGQYSVYMGGEGIIMENCIIRNNNYSRSNNNAIAVYCNSKKAKIKNCIFYNNYGNGPYGKALFIGGDSTLIENCIFVYNDGPVIENGVSNSELPARIINCTIYGNTCQTGVNYPGGIRNHGSALAIRGTIIWDNISPLGYQMQMDSAQEVKYCCIKDCFTDSIGVYKRTPGFSLENNTDLNPVFNSISIPSSISNWFSTDNSKVSFIPSSSAVLEKANFTVDCPQFDLRGINRGSRPIDIGAYEIPPY